MKKLLCAVVMLTLIVSVSCTDSSSSSQTAGAFGEAKKVSEACFDRKMTQWYKSFNDYQSAGYDMDTADKKALADAMMACETCMGEQEQVEE
ncbi:hypothetical protein [Pseudochryseolinea flava]|uniref:Lipoprotein n=1 Tax=Pseudochryseolinea flava TaxID=2059302 RepID=A0A364Y2F4_9BACT|nr:hypothetical protein [Pseudochryseolinea flava]RAW00287.1 hypothetical protein DQQ10_14625 [Pseudochryseolinea flava]